jgi:transposase InsO family protein
MRKHMTTPLGANAMTMAVWRRRPEAAALLHHSDQGSQCANELYPQLLADKVRGLNSSLVTSAP